MLIGHVVFVFPVSKKYASLFYQSISSLSSFSSSGEEPTTERKERTEQELLQEAAGMSPETLQQIRK